MISEIEQRGDDVSDWESQFLDSLNRQDHNLSYKQLETIDRIYQQRVK